MLRVGALAVFVGLVGFAAEARAEEPDPWISRDKAFHFDVSAGIAAAGYGLSAGFIVNARWKALALGGGLAIAVGAGKEIVDATGVFGGDASWKDFTWDAIGAVAGLAIAWGADLLLGGVDRTRPALGTPEAAALAPANVTLRF